MKITEVRNNLFGLSDLKGLIKENTFDEAGTGRTKGGSEWADFFADPENRKYLEDRFGESGFFWSDDEEAAELRRKLARFRPDAFPFLDTDGNDVDLSTFPKGKAPGSRSYIYNRFSGTKGTDPEKWVGRGGYLYKHPNILSQETPIVLHLQELFLKNGGGSIAKPNPAAEISLSYFHEIRNITEKVIEEAVGNNFREFDNSYVDTKTNEKHTFEVGNIFEPFSLFLYFYFRAYICTGTGRAHILTNLANEYKENVDPKYDKIVEKEIRVLKGGSENEIFNPYGESVIATSIQNIILTPVNLNFYDEVNNDILRLLYESYFNNQSGIQKLKSLVGRVTTSHISDYAGTIGGSVLSALYVMGYTNDKKIDEVKILLKTYFNGNDYASLIRGAANRARYNGSETIIAKIAEGYKSNVDSVFDILWEISLAEAREAVKSVVSLENKNPFAEFSVFELPNFDDDNSLSPAERFLLFARNASEILKPNIVERYGSSSILNASTIFEPAGIGLEIMSKNERYLKGRGSKYQMLCEIYADESKPTQEWCFCDLIADDFLNKDKTQREIYYFLKSNTDPATVKWEYEYNRPGYRGDTVDENFGNKSIDILCRYGNGFSKTACFEYQGEQHFRPRGVSPLDENSESPAAKLFMGFKDTIISMYANETRLKKIDKKSEDSKIYDPIIEMVYTDHFENETGEKFIDVYNFIARLSPDRSKKCLRRLSNISWVMRGANSLNEVSAQKARDYSSDEILLYFFILLCKWNTLEVPTVLNGIQYPNEIYDRPNVESIIPFIGSPKRFKEEIHIYLTKISDADKSVTLKRLRWPIAYILPKGTSITDNDIEETSELANPKGSVYRWDNNGKSEILNFCKNVNIPVLVLEEKKSLFEEIVKELLLGNSFQ